MDFPTPSAIADEVKSGLKSSFDALPTKIVKKMIERAGADIAFTVKKVNGLTGILKNAIGFTADLVNLLQQLIKNSDIASFREKLKQFFRDIIELAEQLPRVLVDFQTPAVLKEDFIEAIFSKMPAIGLLPISLVVEAAPGWEKMARKTLEVVKKLPSRADQANRALFTEELYFDVYETRILIKVLKALVQASEEAAPKDLSVNADIAGEGGGTEISGHPAKAPFVSTGLVLELIDLALTNFLDLYSRYNK